MLLLSLTYELMATLPACPAARQLRQHKLTSAPACRQWREAPKGDPPQVQHPARVPARLAGVHSLLLVCLLPGKQGAEGEALASLPLPVEKGERKVRTHALPLSCTGRARSSR